MDNICRCTVSASGTTGTQRLFAAPPRRIMLSFTSSNKSARSDKWRGAVAGKRHPSIWSAVSLCTRLWRKAPARRGRVLVEVNT